MNISNIGSSLALLASAVKPATASQPVTNESVKAAGFTGDKLNVFALAVLAQTLEGQESLLNPSTDNGAKNDAGANNIVSAGISGAQVVAAKYATTQTIAAPVIPATLNITG